MKYDPIRLEYRVILGWVGQGSSVLDVGCYEGELLSLLIKEKNVRAHGIEIDEQAVYKCVARGVSVSHQDVDDGLSDYGDKFFDYVIMNQSLQQVKKPDIALREALRVGKEAIIGFPNFAHYKVRLQVFLRGKTPVTPSLPYEWYNTPNYHFLSISDFIDYCRRRGFKIKRAVFLEDNKIIRLSPNLFAQTGMFLISR